MAQAESLSHGRRLSRAFFALVGILLVLALIHDGAAAETGAPVPVDAMHRGGLYLPSELPGYVVPATTVDTTAHITVSGLVGRARITQRFVNPTDAWVEGVYVFPLPEDAAVDRLRMLIGGRVVEGKIAERAAAQRIYREAADAGRRASLVSQQRPNIFTMAVANIAPHDTITVEIEYQQALSFDGAAGAVSLRFPMVVLPRYIPGTAADTGIQGTGWAANTDRVPDAAAITPPVADPALGPVNPISLTVALDPGFAVAGIDSPYHEITVEQRDGGRFTVSLATGAAWADRDFELVWRPAAGAEPTAALFSETVAGEDFHLMMIMPPHRPAAAETTALPREIVFVIDTSGSMAGTSIVQARQALLYALGRLDGADRFNIIAFNDRPRPLFGAARPADDKALALGRRFVDALVANHGTEMRPALELALSGDGAEGGAIRQVVFITDGSVGNEAELFGVIHDRLGDRRLFTVGIGSAPNSHFMREAAEIGRGSFTYIGAAGEVGDKMAALFARLENPALTDIAIVWPGGATPEAYPATVPDLYLGEPVVVAVRLPRGTGGGVTLSGRDAGAAWTETVTLAPDRPAPGIAALWARAKIAELERARYRGADPAETRRRILEVALAHGLVSAYTSLVAVDDAVVRPDGATLGTDPVATNMPHGVAMQFAAASLDAIRAMAETGSPYRVTRLPNTATPAQANLIFGLVCLILAAGLFWMARRKVRFAP